MINSTVLVLYPVDSDILVLFMISLLIYLSLGDCLIDNELNQALIRQIIDMYAALDNPVEVSAETETEDDIEFSEKGNLEAPL